MAYKQEVDEDLELEETEEPDKKGKKDKKKKREHQSLSQVLSSMNKKYGEGSLIQGRGAIIPVDVWPSGLPSLDLALGCGGIPRGRVIELFGQESSGKTTLTLALTAQCQKLDFPIAPTNGDIVSTRKGVVAFVDAEHAFDPGWATNIGVDVEKLIFSQPSSGEEALDIVSDLVDTGEVDMIIVDSVASLVPREELDGEISDYNIGAQARMMSKALRRLSAKCGEKKCTVVFINQMREKIGVMFGCLHADTLINFVDGRVATIKDVVDQKMAGEVWSYEGGRFVSRPITDWHYNGDVNSPDDYLSLSIRGPGTKNGCMQLTVTPTHEVMTDSGWLLASELAVHDQLLTKQESLVFGHSNRLNGTLGQFLTGVLVGDSNLSHNPKRLAAALKLQDNTDPDYTRWKVSQLNPFLNFTRRHSGPDDQWERYESACFSELLQLKREFPRRDPMLLLDNFSWMGFAVWIMDDATYARGRYTLSIKRLAGNHDKIEQVSKAFDNLGLYHYAGGSGRFVFDHAVSEYIAEQIAKFIPPVMDRKLPTRLRTAYTGFVLERECQWRDAYATVVSISAASGRQMRQRGKYDISIAGPACYAAGGRDNGVIVHNSPDTTPGGKALKFYASVRMQIAAGEPINTGSKRVGRKTNISIKKNKVGPPFTKTEFNLMYGADGIYGPDAVRSLVQAMCDAKLVAQNSSYYIYGDQKYNGFDKFHAAISADSQMQAGMRATFAAHMDDRRKTPLVDMTDEELLAEDEGE